MSGWEIRTRPYRDKAGLDTDEHTVTAIHRGRGWVLVTERMTTERLATYDPATDWAR